MVAADALSVAMPVPAAADAAVLMAVVGLVKAVVALAPRRVDVVARVLVRADVRQVVVVLAPMAAAEDADAVKLCWT